MLEWRNLVCGVIVVVAPASLAAQTTAAQTTAAQTTNRALLRHTGGTWLNRSPAPETSAIFPDYLIQTARGYSANLEADGTSALIQEETVTQFEPDELMLDHGDLQLSTMRQFRVRVNCITVTPIKADATRYEVIDVNGKVRVTAYKNDVKIHYKQNSERNAKESRSSDFVVHEGEQATRDEHCGAAAKPSDAIDAKGAILNSTWAKSAAGGALLLTCIEICFVGDDPISPWKP